MMNILLTNDDGIFSRGLWSLYDQFSKRHDVTVAAPDRERSAVGHGITLRRPLSAEKVDIGDGRSGYAINGTPADSVKIGIREILGRRPNFVISGINPGPNTGVNIHYSGTVAAAREAALFGAKAISVSINAREPSRWADAARFIEELAVLWADKSLPFGTFLNVNIPDVPLESVRGVKVSRQGLIDLMDIPAASAKLQKNTASEKDPKNLMYGPGDDGAVLNDNCISITPIKCDSTDHDVFEGIQTWGFMEKKPAHGGAA
ncbi:5'-nucleotidase SurE [Candidatus Desulfarcum epimagneticum]|uniref:5'-nucleotidase SurE n=1 Tax=uncultured Desulfobacteraceae bacterium TaxID=218296 RepID=A0A484HGC4_9BACT|nr:5'-nucleotidase SurE [uncultured Desulfobacteraceae bacterium]